MRGDPASYQSIAHEDPGYDPEPPEVYTIEPGVATEPGQCSVFRLDVNGDWALAGHLEEVDLEDLWNS